MKILDRYIGLSVLTATVLGVVVLTFVIVLGNVFRELMDLLINRDVPLESVLRFMLYALPFSLTYTIPWGLLTALLLVFGRMSADSELVAMRACGISFWRVSLPALVLACLLSVFCFWVSTEVAPWAEQRMAKQIFQIATSRPASLFVAGEVITEFPGRRIYVGKKEGNRLEKLVLFELDEVGYPIRTIFAREGEINFDEKGMQLLLKVYEALYEQRDLEEPQNLLKLQRGIYVREGVLQIKLDSLYKAHERRKRISAYTLRELHQRLREGGLSEREAIRTRVEINKRYSASLACIAFAVLGIPLGITTHRRETSAGFAVSLVIALVYYFFIILAETFSAEPKMRPDLWIWVPSMVFIMGGGALMIRLVRS
ncbi:MAG: LptF/LptG family permease [Chthoniobacterales bacterium]|nr:LptF/LptG family permease [Chthoniobacterales bacterium]